MTFNPNDTATSDSGIFGLPYALDEAKLVLIPVPWEVTTSYGDGTSRGPQAILEASRQVDLFDIETGTAYESGYYMEPIPNSILELNYEMKRLAYSVHTALENGQTPDPMNVVRVNSASQQVNDWVYKTTAAHLRAGRIAAVVGGDHSSPFGAIRAVSEAHKGEFGILHVDAHADLRDAYQGFEHSHASIMFNVMTSDFRPRKLVQVGIRDFSRDEHTLIRSNERITTHFDPVTKRRLLKGESWQTICDEVAAELPEKVYISFDIDGLTPDLCPNTGTPVPGGLAFEQATALVATLVEKGKTIVGFDLCEVSQPENAENEWDGNVGARLLFKLCGFTMMSNGYRPTKP
ncbi:MAG: agmatinase family protein [Bdellovibrionaceae bacterium]|nr:agmatinase family protein [Pseudobdellovibrionaceae bacterium]